MLTTAISRSISVFSGRYHIMSYASIANNCIIFHGYKNGNFGLKIVIFFLFFSQNIDCGYTLEPPRGSSNEYPRSMF